MKKIFLGLLIAFSLLSVSHEAFAFTCKSGQAGNSDECWTSVKVSSRETNVVSVGSILMYDMTTDSADRNAFEVVLTTTSLDRYKVAGVAQKIIATGDTADVLVRGKGKLIVRGAVDATGDRLYVSTNEGKAGSQIGLGVPFTTASADPVGFALQSATTGPQTTIDAYITILD